jgi:hypothetical protein
LAIVVAVALLLAFNHVVRQGVERGAARRLVSSAQADEGWRCGTSKGARARAECLTGAAGTRLAGQGVPP